VPYVTFTRFLRGLEELHVTCVTFTRFLRGLDELHVTCIIHLPVSAWPGRAALDLCYTFTRFLRGLEELHVPKPLREDLGGGSKEFCFTELLNYSQVSPSPPSLHNWCSIIQLYLKTASAL
jgi:hypothetical protein